MAKPVGIVTSGPDAGAIVSPDASVGILSSLDWAASLFAWKPEPPGFTLRALVRLGVFLVAIVPDS